jgi:peptidoglycan/LPS O-acetylase OafA/YrhL
MMMSHATYLATKHFASLDGVRCLCILAVIWHHCPHPPGGAKLLDRGFLGVDMFFVVSGFLIVTLLLRERARSGRINLKNFYVRRTLRIFPIYYLQLFALALAMLAFKSGTTMARDFWADFPYLVTYTANWIPIAAVNLAILWSLATEEQFYVVWPSVERFLAPRVVLVVIVVFLALNQVVNFGLLDAPLRRWFGPDFVRLPIIDATFTPIILGVVLAHMLHAPRPHAAVAWMLGARWAPLAVFAGLLALCEYGPADISGAPRLLTQLTMAVLLASLVVREDHAARPILNFGPIARLGVISYGMYLYHQWGIHLVREVAERTRITDHLVFFCAAVVVTAIISELSFRLIESPLLRLKARFSSE